MDYYAQLDKAKAMGRKYADACIELGQTAPDDAPLSGEWAGAITLDYIIRALGGDPDSIEDFERTDVADHWEDGYLSAPWPVTDTSEEN